MKSVQIPNEFALHANLQKIFSQAKTRKIETGEGIDWATAEAMAIGTLLLQGMFRIVFCVSFSCVFERTKVYATHCFNTKSFKYETNVRPGSAYRNDVLISRESRSYMWTRCWQRNLQSSTCNAGGPRQRGDTCSTKCYK